MTRDAVSSVNGQNGPSGRRSYRSSRRVLQSDNVSALASNKLGSWDLSGGRGSPPSLLPQLNQSPSKNSRSQYSPQSRVFSGSEYSDVPTMKTPGFKNQKTGNYSVTSMDHSPSAMSGLTGSRRNGQSSTASYFAGSKFGDAPPPTILPPPPSHWISSTPKIQHVQLNERSLSKEECCIGLTSSLKVLLHVP
jgi:hypothetical protein